MHKPSVSLCMIVKNEEKLLPRCLESVKGIVDEIIIVDTGSTDRTVAIAESHQAKVFHFEWTHDFAEARNHSLQQATGDYILVLDADEYLEKEATLQEDLAQAADYYRVPIKNFLEDKTIIHYFVRLFKRSVGLVYKNKVHENLNLDEHDGLVQANATFMIQHTGYLPDVVIAKNKKVRNLDIVKREVEANPNGFNLFNLGVSLYQAEEYEEALAVFKRSYQVSQDKSYVKYLLLNMTECLRNLKRFGEAAVLLHDAINVFPSFTDFHFLLGAVFEDMEYWQDAEQTYQRCLELGDPDDSVTVEGVGGYLAQFRLAALYANLGRRGEAFDMAFSVLQEQKEYRPALRLYLTTMLQAGVSLEESREHLSQVYAVNDMGSLKTLIAALYEARHPLLLTFVQEMKDIFNPDILGVARLYATEYEASRNEWEQMDAIALDNVQDVLLLALLLQDVSLYQRVAPKLNVRSKDKKFIADLIKGQTPKGDKVSEEAGTILLGLAKGLLVLREYERFEALSTYLVQTPVSTQCQLADLLDAFGHHETAIQLLLPLYQVPQPSVQVLRALGDICFRHGYLDDAEVIYEKALHRESKYANYERMYRLQEKLEKQSRLTELQAQMQAKFPLCKWVRSQKMQVGQK